jgi:hypothetical protein
MKKIITLFVLFLSIEIAYTQDNEFNPPQYDSIGKIIIDSTSGYFYPGLWSRLMQYDTTLSTQEYRLLYYGYTFQEKYQPYGMFADDELLKYYKSEKIKEKDYKKIIKLATNSLAEDPFDLRLLNFLAYIYHLNGDKENSMKTTYRFQGIIAAIMSTGDGKTCETGLHVISTSHEYVILNMFEFQFLSQALTSDLCDYMEVKEDERNISGIYFQIKRLWEVNDEKMRINEK